MIGFLEPVSFKALTPYVLAKMMKWKTYRRVLEDLIAWKYIRKS
jgi:hypothetical protein